MDIPHHLVEQIRSGKVVLFFGAGASMGATAHTSPTAPPSGYQLGRLLSEKFLGGDSIAKSLSLISEYCIAESDLRTVQRFIAEIFNRYTPSAAQMAIADFRWAALVTTNYDQISRRRTRRTPIDFSSRFRFFAALIASTMNFVRQTRFRF